MSICGLLLAGPTWAATTSSSNQQKSAKQQSTTKRVAKAQRTKKATVKKKRTKRVRRAPTAVRYLPFTATNPNVHSTSVLVIDESGDDVLYSKRSDMAMPVASITKLMTALVVLDAEQPMDEVLEITSEDREATLGNSSRLVIGAQLTRRDLLHLALMSSENRAANALARNYPGGLEGFIVAMNAKAHQLGMTSAHFDDATGLSPHNVSSAEDLAKLIRAASAQPLIEEFSTSESYEV
jgi:D-alanyl-D-alanine endopeptidase (penicillin-binding protein 7)